MNFGFKLNSAGPTITRNLELLASKLNQAGTPRCFSKFLVFKLNTAGSPKCDNVIQGGRLGSLLGAASKPLGGGGCSGTKLGSDLEEVI